MKDPNLIVAAFVRFWNQLVSVWEALFEGREGPAWAVAKWTSPVVAVLVLWFLLWLLVKLSALLLVLAVVGFAGVVIARELAKKKPT